MRNEFLILYLRARESGSYLNYYTVSGPNEHCAAAGAMWLLGRRPDVLSYRVVRESELAGLATQTADATLAAAVRQYLATFYPAADRAFAAGA